ncbi:MAG: histidine--tRNA ligase [Clostridia bacterium]|nr:histidine--tRNA ligase [Clostridia bacterium]
MMIQIPKGTKDVLPKQSYLWQYVEKTARETAESFGFREIRTPMFEHTELFLRGVGDTTDVVSKEMYTFFDKGNRSITLKPEGTAGVARSFVENGLANDGLPAKMYYFSPAFRYERPQAGRLREHHQFGVELYGAAGAQADAEVITLVDAFYKKLGLKKVQLELNSIGCKDCRTAYNAALKEYFAPRLGEMCEDCNARFSKNPMRMIDCKNEKCKVHTAGAPRMLDYLCPDCRAHFEEVKRLLDGAGVKYEVNPSIVRGLDYYSRTVFEFVSGAAGAQGTVCGGGRYDTLLEQIGGKPVPAVGFGGGIERLLMVMEAEGAPIPELNRVTCYLAGMDGVSREKAFLLANELRSSGVSCETDLMDRSVKAQFKYADKIGARYVAVIGESELNEGAAEVKDMKNSTSERIKFADLVAYLKRG